MRPILPAEPWEARRRRPVWAAAALAAGVLLLLSCGCKVGPDYHRPALDVPGGYRGESEAATNSLADLPWWRIFHDDQLQALVEQAITNNYDLRIAIARVEQAHEQLVQTRAGLFPQIDYEAVAGGGKNVSGISQPSPTGVEGSVFAGDVNASWEIDLWGRIRRQTEAARAQYVATEEARHDVLTSLIAQVAQNYFQLLSLDRQLQIAHDSTNSYGDSLRIFNQRLQGGVASKLETASAEALLDAAAATVPELEQQVALEENQINILLGHNPGPVARTNVSLETELPADIPAGLPSALLERRPDVREAEQQLRAANALIGAAKANFFPQLDLTGLFGRVSPELASLSSGGSVAWSAAASLAGPLFHGGAIRAQYRQAKDARDQAALQYQSTVLSAFQDVSDQLISRDKLAAARASRVQAVAAFQEALKIAQERYRLGTSSYYEVLQQQQQLFPAEDNLVQTELNQVLTVVGLYRALGGGWQNAGAPP
jgi:multidrug efflux system outer membrane protein